MLSKVSFPTHLPYSSSDLPLTLISLEDWALVTLKGTDTIKYLQGQVTCDVESLKESCFSFAAHCNANGKMLSHLCIFRHKDGMAFIERRSVRDRQIAELQKYAIFSQTTITANDNAILLGLAGFQAQTALKKLFTRIPDKTHLVVHHQDATLLYFNLPAPRFLLITTRTMCDTLQYKLKDQAKLNNSQQWLALDIEAGYPIIDSANEEQLIPQAANLQALNGISFRKGCYVGQEAVARTKYRGTNKRILCWLAGKASHLPVIGDYLEFKIDYSWRKTGTVLAACQLKDGSVWVQAVLNKNIELNSLLRVRDDSTGRLLIQTLPYAIGE